MRMSAGLAHTALELGLPLRACMYCRVSNDPTGQHKSVAEQEDSNRAAIAANEWVFDESALYIDNDKSASRFATKDRPDWGRLREAVAARAYHVVVLWEVSRGDRDDLGWIGFLHLCRDLGVLIHIKSHDHTYDVRKRRDYRVLRDEGLEGADESEKTSERILRSVESTARKGTPHTQVPYGYLRRYEVDGRGKRTILAQLPDDQPRQATAGDGSTTTYTRAGVIREIVARLLSGETAWGIAADLNARGVPPPRGGARGWMDVTVRNRALSPTYAGLRVYQGKVIGDASWPGLISKSDHFTLVARLSDPSRRVQRDSRIKHLGSGLFLCGVCGGVVRTVKRDYGRAYACVPADVTRTATRKSRAVSNEEVAALKALETGEQTSQILDLYEAGVSQASVARALGIRRSTLGVRLIAERKRRGYPDPPPRKQPKAGHASRNQVDVDAFVERSVWLRLAREDIADLLAEDARADERLATLTVELAEKQARLDAASDGYAREGKPSLEMLKRIEAQLVPEIERARSQLNEARIGPVLQGLILPTVEEVRAEWYRRDLPQRRAVIRALTDRVEILRIGGGRKRVPMEESVNIVWRQPKTG